MSFVEVARAARDGTEWLQLEDEAMPVHGIGGLFFRARNPEQLSEWYRKHLGVGPGCGTDAAGRSDEWGWMTEAGPVVFAPFSQTSDYFAPDKAFMINLRVSDLDELLEELQTASIEVITKPEWDQPETGRFARIHDPEGNAIELWEPPGS